jgi:protein TonB
MFNPKPDYPPEADRMAQRGVVLLEVEVNAEGRVTGISIKRSSGFPLLDDAAVRGIRRWTFEPARVSGLPIASRAEVPVKFGPPR